MDLSISCLGPKMKNMLWNWLTMEVMGWEVRFGVRIEVRNFLIRSEVELDLSTPCLPQITVFLLVEWLEAVSEGNVVLRATDSLQISRLTS